MIDLWWKGSEPESSCFTIRKKIVESMSTRDAKSDLTRKVVVSECALNVAPLPHFYPISLALTYSLSLPSAPNHFFVVEKILQAHLLSM